MMKLFLSFSSDPVFNSWKLHGLVAVKLLSIFCAEQHLACHFPEDLTTEDQTSVSYWQMYFITTEPTEVKS